MLEFVDGTTLYFTDLDQDINYAGHVYGSQHGFVGSAVQLALGTSGATQDLTFLLDDGLSTTPGILRGYVFQNRLNNAKVTVSWLDWQNPGNGALPIYTGFVTGADTGDYGQIVLHTQTILGQQLPLCYDKYSVGCRYDFGDAGCGVDITQTIGGKVIVYVTNSQAITFTNDGDETPDGYYHNGTAYFPSGILEGLAFEIAEQSYDEAGQMFIILKVPMPDLPDVGQAVTLYGGCDKLVDSGCTYWNNVPRFGGEPFVPNTKFDDITAPSTDVPQPTTPPAAVADTPATAPVYKPAFTFPTAPNGGY